MHATTPPLVLAGLFGLGASAIGAYALHAAETAASVYGAPITGGLARNPFVAAFGARNIALGLAIMADAVFAGPNATAILLLCCVLCGIADTWVTYRFGLRPAAGKHAAGTLVLVGITTWLIAAGWVCPIDR